MVNGWSRKVIWEALREQGKIEFGYQAFLRYVDRIIISPKGNESQKAEETERKGEPSKTPKKLNVEPRRFRWDERKTKEKDLI